MKDLIKVLGCLIIGVFIADNITGSQYTKFILNRELPKETIIELTELIDVSEYQNY